MAWYRCVGGSQKEITLYEVGSGSTANTPTIDNALTQIVRTLNGGSAGYGIGFAMETKGLFKKAKYKSGNDTKSVYVYGLNKGTDGLYNTSLATQIATSTTANFESSEIDISNIDAFFVISINSNLRGLTWLKLYN